MRSHPTWRESLTEWRDIDVLQHELAKLLGIVRSDEDMNAVKALYWAKNPIGDALADFLFALVGAGVLEGHPDDQTLMRWNPACKGGSANRRHDAF